MRFSPLIDDTDSFVDLVLNRWAFHVTGPTIDAVCSSDVVSPLGSPSAAGTLSPTWPMHSSQSGEFARRHSKAKARTAYGPAQLGDRITPDRKTGPQFVWSSRE